MAEQNNDMEVLKKRISELESFTKTYYNCFLDSPSTGIENIDQVTLYAEANRILGSPNGKRLEY